MLKALVIADRSSDPPDPDELLAWLPRTIEPLQMSPHEYHVVTRSRTHHDGQDQQALPARTVLGGLEDLIVGLIAAPVGETLASNIHPLWPGMEQTL